ncbi:MAG: nitrate- and nitrite sensing domain-containing protein [Chromatiales bacterium]|jgi:hypothetical protein
MTGIILISMAITLLLGMFFWRNSPVQLSLSRGQSVVEVCLVLLQLIQELQRHRGLSSVILDGQSGFDEELELTERTLQQSFFALADQYGGRHPVFGSRQWHGVLGEWDELRNTWRALDFVANLFAHNEVVLGLVSVLQQAVAEQPAKLGSKRMLVITQWAPLLEHMGMLRALGMHLLSLQQANADERVSLLVSDHLQYIELAMGQLADQVPDHSVLVASRALIARVANLTGPGEKSFNAQSYYEEMTAMIDQWYRMIRTQLIEVRPFRMPCFLRALARQESATDTPAA